MRSIRTLLPVAMTLIAVQSTVQWSRGPKSSVFLLDGFRQGARVAQKSQPTPHEADSNDDKSKETKKSDSPPSSPGKPRLPDPAPPPPPHPTEGLKPPITERGPNLPP